LESVRAVAKDLEANHECPIVALAKVTLCVWELAYLAPPWHGMYTRSTGAVEELIQTKLNADESSVSAQFGSTIAASGESSL